MSTLIEELEQAVKRADAMANFWLQDGDRVEHGVAVAEATRLRARIEHIKRLEAAHGRYEDAVCCEGTNVCKYIIILLTGPLP